MPQVEKDKTGGGLFRPRRLGHVNYWVEDVESAIDFYRDVAGMEEV